jgi:hypothetical protein
MSLSKEAASFGLAFSEWALLVFALTVVIGLVGEHKLNWWDVKYKTFEILVGDPSIRRVTFRRARVPRTRHPWWDFPRNLANSRFRAGWNVESKERANIN